MPGHGGTSYQPAIAEHRKKDDDVIVFDVVQKLSPLDEYNIRLLDQVHPNGWQDPTNKPKYHMVVIGEYKHAGSEIAGRQCSY